MRLHLQGCRKLRQLPNGNFTLPWKAIRNGIARLSYSSNPHCSSVLPANFFAHTAHWRQVYRHFSLASYRQPEVEKIKEPKDIIVWVRSRQYPAT